MKLRNDQLARIFLMHRFCMNAASKVYSILGTTPNNESAVIFNGSKSEWCEWNEIKIIAVPLDQITDAHAIELVCGLKHKRIIENPIVKRLPGGVNISNNSGGVSMFWHDLRYYEVEYLKLKEYAVPIFLEPQHPLNGATVFDLGIGVELPKENTDKLTEEVRKHFC